VFVGPDGELIEFRGAVKIMAVREGFKEVEILTPQEVIPDED